MNRNSFATLPFLLAKLILCASDGGSPKLSTPRPFNTEELDIFIAGYSQGNLTGYNLGYEEGNSKNLIAYFECAINNLKPLLEVYKEPKTKNLWNGLEENDIYYRTKFKLSDDIEEMIKTNDQWIPLYERKLRGNGYDEDNFLFPDQPEKTTVKNFGSPDQPKKTTGKNFGTHPPFRKRKSNTKLPATTTFSQKEAMDKLILQIRKSAYNWYYIVSCEEECPYYVVRLQEILYQIQANHPDVYDSVTECYFKFAAHTARIYKLLCATHHKFMVDLRDYSKQNKDATFSQALFSCAPSWIMTYEEVFFLNALRDAIYPGRFEPIKYYIVQNSKNDDTLVIYDDSNCPSDQLNKMTKSIARTYKYDFTTTPNVIKTPVGKDGT